MSVEAQIGYNSVPPIIDYGTAKVIQVNGLARVDIMGGETLFALWRWQTLNLEGRMERTRVVVRNIVMATEEVGPAVEMVLCTFGPRLILPAAGYVAKRLLM